MPSPAASFFDAMNAQGIEILECLNTVNGERARRHADPTLASQVLAVKAFQHARFQHTYADLLVHPRYRGAAQFFLDDLYGPEDFVQRDAQFARIVPGLVRLFPSELLATVLALGKLHSLSERLDTAMGEALGTTAVTPAGYGRAWRAVSTQPERERQITLMLEVGHALDRYTRSMVLRHSLRMMRGPAQVIGVGTLQAFLERGFDTFRELRGADEFLNTVAGRERKLAADLFDGANAPLFGKFAAMADPAAVGGVSLGEASIHAQKVR